MNEGRPTEPMTAANDHTGLPQAGHQGDGRPILVIPYMWIGDFVRCHSAVRVLHQRFPGRPVDILATPLTAPVGEAMAGVRKVIVSDLPRSRLALRKQSRLAKRFAEEGYGDVVIMPRTWKAAIAPWLARIPTRTGFAGEARVWLVNDMRSGERQLERMVDRCVALTLPPGAEPPNPIPPPVLHVAPDVVAAWRAQHSPSVATPAVALAPGAVAWAKRWTVEGFGEVARALTARGVTVWVFGGPNERAQAAEIVRRSEGRAHDLTGDDIRQAIVGLAASQVAIANDSGLMHVAAALGTPTIGIFGPTDPWLWGPLNPLAATIQARSQLPCRPCHAAECKLVHHRCLVDISPAEVLAAVDRALEPAAAAAVAL